jgi:hypothetical protein
VNTDEIEVRRSRQRRRTVSAYREGGRTIVLIPARPQDYCAYGQV